ncbi:hypothetical protein QTP88_016902 [Uroleucon formosanum]
MPVGGRNEGPWGCGNDAICSLASSYPRTLHSLEHDSLGNENEKQNVIRCNMNNAEEIAEFLQLFQEKISTNWIVNGQLQNPEKQQIKVQPTAISRRKPGVTRGSKRIPSGRSPTTIAKNKNKKRLHNLNQNINKNQMNATYHGRCS